MGKIYCIECGAPWSLYCICLADNLSLCYYCFNSNIPLKIFQRLGVSVYCKSCNNECTYIKSQCETIGENINVRS